MRQLAAVLIFVLAPIAAKADSQKVNRTNVVRHVTAAICKQLAPWYEFLGQTCRQRVEVAVRQDPKGDTDFLVTIQYTDSSGSSLSASQLIPATQPFDPNGKIHVPWPPTAMFYFDDITLNAVTIELVPSGSTVTITDFH